MFAIFAKTRLETKTLFSRFNRVHFASSTYDSRGVKFYLCPVFLSYLIDHWDSDILKICKFAVDTMTLLYVRKSSAQSGAWKRRRAFVRRPF